jgi:hypothetical protein
MRPAARQADSAPARRNGVQVRNNNFFDVNVYLLDDGARVRLGTVTGCRRGP